MTDLFARHKPGAGYGGFMTTMTRTDLETLRAQHVARVGSAMDELSHQIYQAGGAVDPVDCIGVIAATRAHGYTREEAVEAMNRLVAAGDIIATETFTGLIDTLRVGA